MLKPVGVAVVAIGVLTLLFTGVGFGANTDSGNKAVKNTSEFSMPDKATLKKLLTPIQYRVTQEDGTEPAYRNEFWDNYDHGIYVDIVSGTALYSSLDKYDSNTGWPSFTHSINEAEIVQKPDTFFFMTRIEIRSATADSHLGHLFNDGPVDRGGLRHCINSASLRFVPLTEMEEKGYSKYLQRFVDAGLHS